MIRWKSIHGLKHQTVDNALGFTIDVFGPVPLRGNDMSLFRESNINQRMGKFGEYKIFGNLASEEAIIRIAHHTDQTQVSTLK